MKKHNKTIKETLTAREATVNLIYNFNKMMTAFLTALEISQPV